MDNTIQIEISRAQEQDMSFIKERLSMYLLDGTNIECSQFFIARKDGKKVAFARILDHDDYFELASLGVDYYHRSKGIGTKVTAFLIEEAKRLDQGKPIYGVTHRESFLKNLGFEEVSTCPEYLSYKKNHICKYPHKIKIMKFRGGDGDESNQGGRPS